MTKILAIDSSTEACSVAIMCDGEIYDQFQLAPRKHAELLLPMVDQQMKLGGLELSALEAIACCVGPGAFTGLRIAISVAQGLAFATDKPCIAVSSLQTMATEAFNSTEAEYCLSAIDARMQEVYFAGFRKSKNGMAVLLDEEIVVPPSSLKNPVKLQQAASTGNIVKVGKGWSEYSFDDTIENLSCLETDIRYPNAKWMLPVAENSFKNGELLKPEELQPVYLRNNVAKKKSERN